MIWFLVGLTAGMVLGACYQAIYGNTPEAISLDDLGFIRPDEALEDRAIEVMAAALAKSYGMDDVAPMFTDLATLMANELGVVEGISFVRIASPPLVSSTQALAERVHGL